MNRKQGRSWVAIAGAVVLAAGCATGGSQRVKTVRVLEAEHGDHTVVIVTTRPARERRCWKHGGHWHCRRR